MTEENPFKLSESNRQKPFWPTTWFGWIFVLIVLVIFPILASAIAVLVKVLFFTTIHA